MKSANLCEIGARIAQKRKQTGLLQPDFARKYGVSRNTQIEYEKGRTAPSGDYLIKMAEDGIDVQQLLIGYDSACIKEPAADYCASSKGADIARLTLAIEAVADRLAALKAALSPRKMADVVSLAYDLHTKPGVSTIDYEQVARLVDLAV